MFLEIDGLNVFYERKTGTGKPVLLLHGWGCGAETMRRIFDCFSLRGRDVTALDFPGFGLSGTPDPEFTVYDYARLTNKLITKLGIENPDVIAHSFGGRIALILAAEGKVGRLILTGGAGLRPRRGPKYYYKIWTYKLRRRLGLKPKENAGSADYRALNPAMRRVFVSVVNTHLDKTLRHIGCPVLLIWGGEDRSTPLYMARRMVKRISDCALIIFEDSGHFAFLSETARFNSIALTFFGEDI